MNHCCKEMNYHILQDELHFGYSPRKRQYSIDYKEICGGGVQLINFCPWCGKKLPKKLGDRLGDILIDDLELDNMDFDPRMPEEFKTDAWWKKRGL